MKFGIILKIFLFIGHIECRIIFTHPDLVSHYLHRRCSTVGIGSRTNRNKFSSRLGLSIHSLCFDAIRSAKLHVLTSDESMNISNAELIEDVFDQSDINIIINADSTIANETIVVPGIEGGVNIIRCATVNGRSLYIENGNNSHEYFIFKETGNLEGYKIGISLFEPHATWNVSHKRLLLSQARTPTTFYPLFYHIRNNELIFMNTHIKIPGREKRNICLLQGIERLKVCSILYRQVLGLFSRNQREIRQFYIRDKLMYDDCKSNVHVKFLDPQYEAAFKAPDYYHTVDLVPCAVNSEWRTPTFYVGLDPSTSTGIFIFSSIVGVFEQYSVLARVKDLQFLKYPPFNLMSHFTSFS